MSSESETPYAIGQADYFDIIVIGGTWRVQYDVKQAQEDDLAKYVIPEYDEEMIFETDELTIGDTIPLEIADDLQNHVGYIYGYIVPERLLGQFIEHYRDTEMRVYPE